MKLNHISALITVITVLVFCRQSILSAADEGKIALVAKDGNMTLVASNATLSAVFRLISEKTKISFKAEPALLQPRLSIAFENLPYDEGVKRILAGFNYSLIYKMDGTIQGVVLLARTGEKQSGPVEGTLSVEEAIPLPDPLMEKDANADPSHPEYSEVGELDSELLSPNEPEEPPDFHGKSHPLEMGSDKIPSATPDDGDIHTTPHMPPPTNTGQPPP